MNKTVRTVCLIITSLLLVGSIAFLLWQVAQKGWKFDFSENKAAIFVIVGLVLSLIRLIARETNSKPLSVYEKAYEKEIGSAFSRPDNKKYRKELLKATALYNENQFVSAVKKLDKIEKNCSSVSDYTAVYFFRALCYTDSGRRSEAIAEYETLLKYDPKHATALSNLGILYDKVGKRDLAAECYRKSIELDPENAYAWNNLAQLYMTLCEWEKVIEPAQQALKLKSNMYQAHSALCAAYHMLGKPEESKKHFDLAVANGSNRDTIKRYLELISQKD